MAKMKVKTGDKVLILTGKDHGKTGEVLAVYPEDGRVVVKGVNVVSKNKKARKAREKGGIIKFEGKIDVSNVQVVCPACGKATRVASTITTKGERHRTCKKCNASVDTKKAFKKIVKESKDAKDEKDAPKKEVTEAAQATKVTIKDAEKNQSKVKTTAAKTGAKSTAVKTAPRSGK